MARIAARRIRWHNKSRSKSGSTLEQLPFLGSSNISFFDDPDVTFAIDCLGFCLALPLVFCHLNLLPLVAAGVGRHPIFGMLYMTSSRNNTVSLATSCPSLYAEHWR